MAEDTLTVGVIGLGRIGRGVAGALDRAGFAVVGTDTAAAARAASAERATIVDSPAAVAERSQLVLIAVLDDDQAREVLDGPTGILRAAPLPQTVVVLSTVTIETLRWAGDVAHHHGVALLDCAVSGGHDALERAEMTAMVGGSPAAFEQALPVLQAFLSPVIYMGPLGNGMRAKLARNLIVYGQWLVAWEGARLAVAAGVDLDRFLEVIRASDRTLAGPLRFIATGAGLSEAVDLDQRAAGEATAVYAHKDLRYALEMGGTYGLELPVAALTDRLFDQVAGIDPPQ